MRLTVHAEGPAIDIDRFVRAIPLLLDRSRGVAFGDDGRAILDGVATERLQLIDGTAGRPGAAYRVLDEKGEATAVTVTRDDADVLGAELSGGLDDGGSTTTAAGSVTLERPEEAIRVLVAGAMSVDEAPRIIGSQWDFAGQARLADWDAPGEPQISIQLIGRLGSARSTARIDRRPGGGPGAIGAEADLWDVTLDIDLEPRGVARLASLAFPFVRRRVTEVIARQITDALLETAIQIAEDFDPEDGPEEIADRAWELIVADLTAPAST